MLSAFVEKNPERIEYEIVKNSSVFERQEKWPKMKVFFSVEIKNMCSCVSKFRATVIVCVKCITFFFIHSFSRLHYTIRQVGERKSFDLCMYVRERNVRKKNNQNEKDRQRH